MRKLLYLLYQPYKWFVVVPVFALSTVFFGVLGAALAILVSPSFGGRVSGTAWGRLNAFVTPMWVRVRGRERIEKGQSYVVVANHPSSYDTYVLYGWLGVDFRWVLKQELRRAPGLGFGCEKMGHIFVDRSNARAARQAIEAAKERITGGTSVIFFVEGTHSKNGEMRPFKRGAFRMAIDLELPILPVTIDGTWKIHRSGTMDVFPGTARMIIHPPVDVAGFDRKNIEDLLQQVRDTIASELDQDRSRADQGGPAFNPTRRDTRNASRRDARTGSSASAATPPQPPGPWPPDSR